MQAYTDNKLDIIITSLIADEQNYFVVAYIGEGEIHVFAIVMHEMREYPMGCQAKPTHFDSFSMLGIS